MIISYTYTYQTRIPDNVSLLKPWHIENAELSILANRSLKLAQENPGLKEAFSKIAIGCQCLIEFSDLLPLILPQEGCFLNIHYLYFEALSVFRDSILAGINNSFHSSFASLRSALEMIIYHIWWHIRSLESHEYSEYYDWLYGKEHKSPAFTNIYSCVFDSMEFPKSASNIRNFKEVYALLCSYVHKPFLSESITSIKQSNEPDANINILEYWTKNIIYLLEIIIDLLIASKPMSLFPKEIWRKYGFNLPIGLFFDPSNYLPYERWLGEQKVKEYKNFFSNNENIISTLKDYEMRESFSNDAILSSWSNKEGINDLPSDTEEDKIIQRWVMTKSETRMTIMILSYSFLPHYLVWNNGQPVIAIKTHNE